jgi:hypothetical protein
VLGEGGAAAGSAEGEGGEGGAELPKEAQVYVDAKTYVYLEIELQRPLIPRRPASVLAQRFVTNTVYMYMYMHNNSGFKLT